MPPLRKIASNLLWTPQGIVRDPLLTLAPDGSVRTVAQCPEPDRMAGTEFYAGLLVPDFPDDYRAAFEWMRAQDRPLDTLLPELSPGRTLVVLSGLDYGEMRLTGRSEIRKI